jgi:hypothetical protein
MIHRSDLFRERLAGMDFAEEANSVEQGSITG